MFDGIISFFMKALYIVPIYFISITIHELAHGFVAYKLGDPTAKDAGRLTFNPIRHLDPYGLLMMLFFGFGWAKPVPVNPQYFRKPKRDMLFTSLAGPASNYILAFFSYFFFRFCKMMAEVSMMWQNKNFRVFFTGAENFFSLFVFVNVALMVFNLIPIYPLDGSRILNYFLPNSVSRFIEDYGAYFYIAFFVLLLTTNVISIFMTWMLGVVTSFFEMVWYHPAQGLVHLIFRFYTGVA